MIQHRSHFSDAPVPEIHGFESFKKQEIIDGANSFVEKIKNR